MIKKYNHTLDCWEVFYEPNQEKPAMHVFDTDVMTQIEGIEEISDIWSIVGALEEAGSDAAAQESYANESACEVDALHEQVVDLEDELNTAEERIAELELEVKRLNSQLPRPKPIFPTEDQIVEMIDRRNCSLDNPGWCIRCGEEQDGCEPDARGYVCDSCGEKAVYAPEELLLRGLMKRVREIENDTSND